MLTLSVTHTFWQLISFRPVHTPCVGKEQQPVVRRRHEELLHHIVPTQAGTRDALTTSVLGPVQRRLGALCIPSTSNGDDNFLFRDEVLHGHIPVEPSQNLGTAVVAVTLHNRVKLFRHDLTLTRRRFQDVVVVLDQLFDLLRFFFNLETFKRCQTTQLQVQNRICLDVVDIQQFHQAGPRLI